MIYIISGTNRPGSRTIQVSQNVLSNLKQYHSESEIIDLAKLPYDELTGRQYGGELHSDFKLAIQKIDSSDGLIIVIPEYNGSYPGALKYFIDHWSYPKSFEYRPVAFIGLGFRWGGLRPVEHLQQVFNYRNSYVFPERVFLTQIGNTLVDGKIIDDDVLKLINRQLKNFVQFVGALKDAKLHANMQ